MKPSDRARLTAALREHVARIAADMRTKVCEPGAARARAQKLHADEQVGEDFEVWTDLLSRRAAVLWVLKSVYVRVLEDRGLLSPGRLLDLEAEQLFERIAPNLGETAFLRWIYRDLASPNGGLPELFSPQPAEVALPSDDLSRKLIAFWRDRDPDTGAQWSFAEERFEGELMGDLYQELDPVVKERFALCQTPDFVREFILDRTLTPAIDTFGADQVRLLDPACGSGHFLIDGLKRLVEATASQHPEWTRPQVVTHALDRVVGIDLNDYACALARTRLVMTAAELAGARSLADAAQYHPHVYWSDALEQVEREESRPATQVDLFPAAQSTFRAVTLTPPEVRMVLRRVLQGRFSAVVANPPYITESDDRRRAYHRAKAQGRQRYVSAYRLYSLAGPFVERCYQLCVRNGFVGIITSNNFMKAVFGKPFIEQVLASVDLQLVVDTSHIRLPHHGTSTVLLFGSHRQPQRPTVRAVLGRRGETDASQDPSSGQVWRSICDYWRTPGFENEYVSVEELPRAVLDAFPWSLEGGAASKVLVQLERARELRLGDLCADIGAVALTRADDVFLAPKGVVSARLGNDSVRPYVRGEDVRNWSCRPSCDVVYPYTEAGKAMATLSSDVLRWLLRYRTLLEDRVAFGKSQLERGLQWFEYSMLFPERLCHSLGIAFSNVATHNHFALQRAPWINNSHAPVIKLAASASEDDYLAVLGILNSSLFAFWMRQVFKDKGSGGVGGGYHAERWSIRLECDATKLKRAPIIRSPRAIPYARELDALAAWRSAHSADAILDDPALWSDAKSLRSALDERRASDEEALLRMIALQEELDWLCYELYGMSFGVPIIPTSEVRPIVPTWLPWAIRLANRDARIDVALTNGEQPGEVRTEWFVRHGWEPVLELPADTSDGLRAITEIRLAEASKIPAIGLLETATYKRRWFRPAYVQEEQQALASWFAQRTEGAAKERRAAFSVEQLAVTLQSEPRVLAVCEVLTGRRDFSLALLIADALRTSTVPSHPAHIYKSSGLLKHKAWERSWEDQRRRDAGDRIVPDPAPTYDPEDFLRPEYGRLRGKLDVPKERCIAFTEVPGPSGANTLYGWAGWTPLQRLKAILGIDEELDDAGVPLADRVGLLDSAWRLLPDVAREDSAAATRLKAELQALVGADGPSREMMEDWRKRFPPPTVRGGGVKRAARRKEENEGEEE